MLKSVLLYLNSLDQASPVIDLGVELAKKADARVRGLTLVDTRRSEDALTSESAVYLSMAQSRQAVTETIQEQVRETLSKACLKARLNFDVRRISGNPLEILPAESRFHDLVIVSPEKANRRFTPGVAQPGLSTSDMRHLLRCGVQPLVVLPRETRAIDRVLLVYDGTEAAGRSIRAYWSLGVLRNAEHRLLAIGRDENQARSSLAEMAEYCGSYRSKLEVGFAIGKSQQVLVSYAAKWGADMLVLGAGSTGNWIQRFTARLPLQAVRDLNCALFVHA